MHNPFKIDIPANRVYGLDILRAIAILFVLLTHSKFFLPAAILPAYDHLAVDGVSIFFVLSGYLIGGILIKTLETKELNFTTLFTFWKNRWLRTVPPYVFILCLLVLINVRHLHPYVLKYFVFTQNLWKPIPPFFGESWSLTVEEWFYLLIPPALFVLCRFIRQKYAILTLAISIIIIIANYRYSVFAGFNKNDYRAFDELFRKTVVLRLDSIMYGVIAAYMVYYYKQQWLKYKFAKLLLGIAIIVLYQVTLNTGQRPLTFFDVVIAISMTSIGTFLMLPFCSQILTGKGIIHRALSHVSLVSYSMYLINWSIIFHTINDRVLPKIHSSVSLKNTLGYCLYWFLTITLSTLMYKYIELPSMRLRNQKKEAKVIA